MKTAEKIKKLRTEKGYTQEELARKIGVKKAAINKYETGRVVNIKAHTLTRLAEVLGVLPYELLDDIPAVKVDVVKPVYLDPDYSATANRIIVLIDELNNEGQEKLLEYAEMLNFTGLYKKCDSISEEAEA